MSNDPPAQCPGCHRVTEWLELQRGAGANRYVETKPSWCVRCLRRKIAEAVAGAPLWT